MSEAFTPGPESVQGPVPLEDLLVDTDSYTQDALEYSLLRNKKDLIQRWRADSEALDEDRLSRIAGAEAAFPDEETVEMMRRQKEEADAVLREKYGINQSVDLNVFSKIVSVFAVSRGNQLNSEDRSLIPGDIGENLPKCLEAVKELARIRQRSYTMAGNYFSTVYPSVGADSDVPSLLLEGRQEDVEWLEKIATDDFYADLRGVAIEDIDRFYEQDGTK